MRKINLMRVLTVIVGLAIAVPAVSPAAAQSNSYYLQQQRAQQAAANARRAQDSARQAQMMQQRQQQMIQQQQRQQALQRQQQLQLRNQTGRNNSAATLRRDEFNSAAGVTVRTRPGMRTPQPSANVTRSAPTTAIRGTPTRNVGANEGRGFVSSGGIAKLTKPLTPGQLKSGFTGKMTGDGRALVRFQGRIFAVPARGLGILPPNMNRLTRQTPQQRGIQASRIASLAQSRSLKGKVSGGSGPPPPPPSASFAANDNVSPNMKLPSGALKDLGPLRSSALKAEGASARLIGSAEGLQTRKTSKFFQTQTGDYITKKNTYLWTIDDKGINIALEKQANSEKLKHTNLSEKAHIGGEAWFDGDTVTVNAASGRFGDGAGITRSQWAGAVSYWKELGYNVRYIEYGRR